MATSTATSRSRTADPGARPNASAATDDAAASSTAPEAARGGLLTGALYVLGGLLLAGEAAVHVQQFVVLFHGVRCIGPLFVANATACVVAIAGLAPKRTRPLAAFAGIAISTAALGALIVSYAVGLFGWMEAGLPMPIAIAVATEVGAAIALGAALAATSPVYSVAGPRGPSVNRARR